MKETFVPCSAADFARSHDLSGSTQTVPHRFARSAPVRVRRARMLEPVFDIERCACGGKLKFVALIEKPDVLEKILSHIGLTPPPVAPVRREELFKAASRAGSDGLDSARGSHSGCRVKR